MTTDFEDQVAIATLESLEAVQLEHALRESQVDDVYEAFQRARLRHIVGLVEAEISRKSCFKEAIERDPLFVRLTASKIAIALVRADMPADIGPLVRAAVLGLAHGVNSLEHIR